jgi:hypothetical protein
MLYVDLLNTYFDLTLTLGDADTLSPPPLLLSLARKGTNTTASFVLPTLGMIPGARYVRYIGILTSLVPESGQYDYQVYDNTNPVNPTLIEEGLLIATSEPITKESYGTDKIRGEYKDHI